MLPEAPGPVPVRIGAGLEVGPALNPAEFNEPPYGVPNPGPCGGFLNFSGVISSTPRRTPSSSSSRTAA